MVEAGSIATRQKSEVKYEGTNRKKEKAENNEIIRIKIQIKPNNHKTKQFFLKQQHN